VAKPQRLGPRDRFDDRVQALRILVQVYRRRLDPDVRRLGDGKADRETAFIDGAQGAVGGARHVAVSGQFGAERFQVIARFNAPYGLAHGGPVAVRRRRQRRIVDRQQANGLTGRRLEERTAFATLDGIEPPIFEIADSGSHIGDAVDQGFDAGDRHGICPSDVRCVGPALHRAGCVHDYGKSTGVRHAQIAHRNQRLPFRLFRIITG
jgi:hypothetical protein